MNRSNRDTGSEDVLDILRTTTLFAGFTEEQLEMVPKVARRRRYEADDKIIEVDDTGPAGMFLVLEGTVEVRVDAKTINSLGPGDHFGEMALLVNDAARSADVVATAPTLVLEFMRSHLLGLVSSTPEIALGMLAELAGRLRRTTEILRQVAEASPEGNRLVLELERGTPPSEFGSLDPIECTPAARG